MKKEVFPIESVIAALEQEVAGYAVPVVDLIAAQTKDPLKVLLATILSARTKDEVTAVAVKRLFAQADSLEALEQLSLEKLEEMPMMSPPSAFTLPLMRRWPSMLSS
ncbi:MAG: hypothetical protein D3922_00285, partial [Candidatus Electrothrix sp. AR1]|nr:hypothetical protein [Candidatus Electrothrix sp. AR1]